MHEHDESKDRIAIPSEATTAFGSSLGEFPMVQEVLDHMETASAAATEPPLPSLIEQVLASTKCTTDTAPLAKPKKNKVIVKKSPDSKEKVEEPIDAYSTHLRAVNKYKLLTHEEELALGAIIQPVAIIDNEREDLLKERKKIITIIDLKTEAESNGGKIGNKSKFAKIDVNQLRVRLEVIDKRLRQIDAWNRKPKNIEARRKMEVAVDKFVNANLRLVLKLGLKRCKSNTDKLLEIIAEGNIGLLKAVKRFDPKRRLRFATFATWWINSDMKRANQDNARTVRTPVYMQDQERAFIIVIKYMEEVLHLDPSDNSVIAGVINEYLPAAKKTEARKLTNGPRIRTAEEETYRFLRAVLQLAKVKKLRNQTGSEALQVKLEKIRESRAANFTVSMNQPVGNGDMGLGELQAAKVEDPDKNLVEDRSKHVVRKILDKMEDRYAYILGERFGIPTTGQPATRYDPVAELGRKELGKRDLAEHERTFEEIGGDLKLTRERIRQLEVKAIQRFLAIARNEGITRDTFRDYLSEPG